MARKKIYLLLGPKGAGKTFLGGLMEEHYQVPFLRVEDTIKELAVKVDVNDEDYLKLVFSTIETHVRNKLNQHDSLSFESTGLSNYYDEMLASLQLDFDVITIGIKASPESCLQRIKSRDQSIHIPFDDQELMAINTKALSKQHNLNHIIENESLDKEQLVEKLEPIVIPGKI